MFRVELKIRNASLYRAIHEKYKNVSEFCANFGLQNTVVGELLNLKRNPLLESMEWSKPALAVAEALGVLPDEIFPEACQIRLETASAAFDMTAPEVALLMEDASPIKRVMDLERAEDLDKILKTLKPREEVVLRRRFGFDGGDGDTFEKIGESLGIGAQRVMQIERHALRKLRSSAHVDLMREHDCEQAS